MKTNEKFIICFWYWFVILNVRFFFINALFVSFVNELKINGYFRLLAESFVIFTSFCSLTELCQALGGWGRGAKQDSAVGLMAESVGKFSSFSLPADYRKSLIKNRRVSGVSSGIKCFCVQFKLLGRVIVKLGECLGFLLISLWVNCNTFS